MVQLRRAGFALKLDQQASCHGKKVSDMMAFAIPERGLSSAIGAAGGKFFHPAHACIAGKAHAC
jgi:hypothetical protein